MADGSAPAKQSAGAHTGPKTDPAAFSIDLATPADKARVLALIQRLPANESVPFNITITRTPEAHTGPQRRAYWSMVHRFADELGEVPFAIHYELVNLFLPDRAHLLFTPGADITKDLTKRAYSRLLDGALAHLSHRAAA